MHIHLYGSFFLIDSKEEPNEAAEIDAHAYYIIHAFKCMFVCLYVHTRDGERNSARANGKEWQHVCVYTCVLACVRACCLTWLQQIRSSLVLFHFHTLSTVNIDISNGTTG